MNNPALEKLLHRCNEMDITEQINWLGDPNMPYQAKMEYQHLLEMYSGLSVRNDELMAELLKEKVTAKEYKEMYYAICSEIHGYVSKAGIKGLGGENIDKVLIDDHRRLAALLKERSNDETA